MSKSPGLVNALFAEVAKSTEKRRKSTRWSDKVSFLRAFLRPHQRVLEADRAPLVAVRSARQVGKSTAALLIATIRCLEQLGYKAGGDQPIEYSWVVIGLTRGSVKKAYWSVLQWLNDKYELGIKFQFQELTATFPNGSVIYFFGADKIDELEKLRGGRYHGVIVDESKSYDEVVFKTLIEDVLGPALMGQAGQLYVIGTPGDVLRGEFYLATCDPAVLLNAEADDPTSGLWSNRRVDRPSPDGRKEIWSLHVWTLQDNDVPFHDAKTGRTFTLWEKALEIKALRRWPDNHPTWRREYLGEWVPTDQRLVYRYRPHVHDYSPQPDHPWGLPGGKEIRWHTVLGADFGTKDGTSLVVWAYADNYPGLWELYSEKRKTNDDLRLSVSALARWIREVEERYGPFESMVGDPAGLATMVIESLAVDHQVYVEAAEKREKVDHIELFNNDLDAGLINLRRGGELGEEMLGNRWLLKTIGTEKRKEDPATPNDLCDAGLYAFRWARHRQSRPDMPRIPIGSRAWWAEQERLDRAEALRRAKAGREDAPLDREWWNDQHSSQEF